MNKIILWVSIIFFIVFFSNLSIKRYRTLNSYYYDLGIMNQVVYNTSRGRFLEMTNPDLERNTSRLAIHFDPILAVFAPFYWIYRGPEVLLIGQAIILGLGAWVVYLIAERVLKKRFIPLIFSLSYLFYFAVQRTVLFDFHAVTLATTFFLFALYFNLVKKTKLYFLFIFLSLLTKEHVGLVVFVLGLYLFFIKKEKKVGLLTSFLGLIFFVGTVYFVIPYFRGGEHFAASYFVDFKLRLKIIIQEGINYSKLLLSPAIYSLFSPLTLIIAIPEWAINVLSINVNQRSFFFHYNSIIVAFIYYSMIFGYKNFNRLIKNKIIQTIFFLTFLFLSFQSIYKHDPVPRFVKNPVGYRQLDVVTQKSLDQWIEKLKDENIKVSTTPKLAPFFTNRITYYNFLYDSAFAEMGLTEKEVLERNIDKYTLADYIIIYKQEVGRGLANKFYDKLLSDKNFQKIFSDKQEIEIYKKI